MAWVLVFVTAFGVTVRMPVKTGEECVGLIDKFVLESMIDKPKEIRCEVKWL